MSTTNNQVNNAGVNTVNQKNFIPKPQRRRRKPQPCQLLSGSSYRFRHEFPESWFIQGRLRVDGRRDWFFYPPTTDPQEPRQEIRTRKKARLHLLEEEKKAKELVNNAGVNTVNQENSIQKLRRRRRKQPCQILSGSLYRYRHEFPESWFIQGRQRVNGHKDWFFYPPTKDPQEPREEIRSRKKAKLRLLEEENKAKELFDKSKEIGQAGGFSSPSLNEIGGKEIVLYSPRSSTERNDYYQEVHILENYTHDDRCIQWNSEYVISTSRRKNWKNMARNACKNSEEISGKEIVLYSPPSSTERNDYYQKVHRLKNYTHEDRCIRWNSEHVISTSRRKNWKNMARNACKNSDCVININDYVRRQTPRRKQWKNMARNVSKDTDSEINKSHSTRVCKRMQLDLGEEHQPSPLPITKMFTNVFDAEIAMEDNPNWPGNNC